MTIKRLSVKDLTRLGIGTDTVVVLEPELAALEARLAAAEAALSDLQRHHEKEIGEHQAALSEARTALERLQWAPAHRHEACRGCGNVRGEGHVVGCFVAQALTALSAAVSLEPCKHLRQWIIPTTTPGTGWCFRCGAINLTGEWIEPDHGGNGAPIEAQP